MDRGLVYWNYGGATVVTTDRVRLTQDTQDKKGWLWNDYPLEQEWWEVEFQVEIFSSPNYGGDGMCMWVVSSNLDPSFAEDGKGLSGPLLGMKNDFEGVGVCIDVYDNDQRRNNPQVFALFNSADASEPRTFNHDNDYEDDMVKGTNYPGFGPTGLAHKCVADVRNSGKPHKFLVKFLHSLLHVYIDAQTGSGFKFCFVVRLNQTFPDYHLAFTATTGQVADMHDLHSIQVRYLDNSDQDIDDSQFASYTSGGLARSWTELFFQIISLITLTLLVFGGYQLYVLRKLTSARIDIVNVVKDLTKYVQPFFIIQWVLTFFCLCTMNWGSLLINSPLAIFRLYLYFAGEMRFTEGTVTGQGQKGHNTGGVPAMVRLVINMVHSSIAFTYCIYWFL